jgi:omega-hydroxy-beta-dihydromenaquinone-9 sulfotransferase
MKKNNRDINPIFIIGCPRSGTTIFTDILSYHKDFSWPSQYVNMFSKYPHLSFFSRIYDMPFIGNKLKRIKKKKILPYPIESMNFFNSIDSNFYPLPRSSIKVQQDSILPSEKIIKEFQKKVDIIKKYQGKHWFIAKYAGKSRIRYLNTIFPQSYFIHILRDGRGVVNSLYTKMIYEGWIADEERKNWIETFPQEWKSIISASSDPTISFLCYYYKHIVNRIKEEQAKLPKERTMTICYDEFNSEPIKTFKKLCNNLEIDYTKDFEEYILSKGLKNYNYKWKKNLSHSQKKELKKILKTDTSTI